jgi:hypothetical protein
LSMALFLCTGMFNHKVRALQLLILRPTWGM